MGFEFAAGKKYWRGGVAFLPGVVRFFGVFSLVNCGVVVVDCW
jgi:hypothetical protein